MEISLSGKFKNIFWASIVEVLAVAIAIGGVVFLDAKIQETRKKIYISKETISQGLSNLSKESALRLELEKRSHDLDRIREFVLKRESVGDYITALEREASRLDVDLHIPSVGEEIIFDSNGNTVEQEGVLKKVRIKINVSGDKIKLLDFLNSVEYQPYLSGVVGWKMITGKEEGSLPLSLRAGVLNMPNEGDGKELPGKPTGRVEMDILLSIFNDKGDRGEK